MDCNLAHWNPAQKHRVYAERIPAWPARSRSISFHLRTSPERYRHCTGERTHGGQEYFRVRMGKSSGKNRTNVCDN